MATAAATQLVAKLARQLDGLIRTDQAAIRGATRDFGQVISKAPVAVIQPAHVGDVATLLREAQAVGCPVAIRGAGHSQGGQALVQGGLVIDTSRLDKIDEINQAEGWVKVGAGLFWSALVRTVAAYQLLPPVLTDHTGVTIGGTLAVGGVGPTSLRWGLQVDHCLGVELVLGTGEVLWLTPEHEADLFTHTLGGLGQLGVMTNVQLRLRPFQPYTETLRLVYPKLTTFLQDALFFIQQPQVQGLEGFARPSRIRAQPLTASSHHYMLEVSLDADAAANSEQLLAGVNAAQRPVVVKRPTVDYLLRQEQIFAGYRRPVMQNQARPWVEHFMPLAAVEEYVAAVAAAFPTANLLLWPMPGNKVQHAMVAGPATPTIVLVGIMMSIPPAQVEEILPRLQWASDLGIALGGKRYLSGWLNFDPQQWQTHYGRARWQRICQLKQRCDPNHILQALPWSNPFAEHPPLSQKGENTHV